MTNNHEERLILRTTCIDNDDVKSEASLVELETGNKPSLRIIRNKLQNQEGRIFYYGTYHKSLDTARSIFTDHNRSDQLQVVNRIINWALEQSPHIQDVVFSFLDAEDKEELVDKVIRDLGFTTADTVTIDKPKKKYHMTDMMRKSLPATKEELVLLIQSVSPTTKRPASTVRQFLRTETRAGKIYLAIDERYYHAT